jgi:hypothetical protein
MLHRIINWIINPFKKKEEEEVKFTLPPVTSLTVEQKSKIKADLIEAVREFRENKDLDALPISKVSEDVKEKIADLVKEDLKDKKLPNIEHEVVITETLPNKKKRYYKKKKSSDTVTKVANK